MYNKIQQPPPPLHPDEVAALGGTGRRQGQHDGAQRRQLVIQLTRLAALEKKTSREDTEFISNLAVQEKGVNPEK
jgi:hypothetical protein